MRTHKCLTWSLLVATLGLAQSAPAFALRQQPDLSGLEEKLGKNPPAAGLEEAYLEPFTDDLLLRSPDLQQIQTLLKELWKKSGTLRIPRLADLEHRFRSPRFSFVARDPVSGQIVGFSSASRLQEEGPDVLYLSYLAVDEERQREGIGRKLMEAIFDAASKDPSFRTVEWDTPRSNADAQGFYDGLQGVQRIGEDNGIHSKFNVRYQKRLPVPADQPEMVLAGLEEGILRWSLPLKTVAGHRAEVKALSFSSGGKTLVSGGLDGYVAVRDVASGAPVSGITNPKGAASSVAIAPDHQTIAFGEGWEGIRLFDSESGQEKHYLASPGAISSSALAFSPDGSTLVSSERYGSLLYLWDATQGQLKFSLEGHSGVVDALAFSPDGKVFASGDTYGRIRFWDPSTGQLLRRADPSANPSVASLAFSPDGRTLASGHSNGIAYLWDAATGLPLTEIRMPDLTEEVTALTFSPDGKTLAFGNRVGAIYLAGRHTGKIWAALVGHAQEIGALAFSPDGKTLASADAAIRLWDVAELLEMAQAKKEGPESLERLIRLGPLFQTLRSDQTSRPPLSERVRVALILHEAGILVPAAVKEAFEELPSLGSRQAGLLSAYLYRIGVLPMEELVDDLDKLARWETQAKRGFGEDHLFGLELHTAIPSTHPEAEAIQDLFRLMMRAEGNLDSSRQLRVATIFEDGGLEIQTLPSYGWEVQAKIWERWEDLAEAERFDLPLAPPGRSSEAWLHANFGGSIAGEATEVFLYRWTAVDAEFAKEDAVRAQGISLRPLFPENKAYFPWDVRLPRPSKLGEQRTEVNGMVYVVPVMVPNPWVKPLDRPTLRAYRRQLFKELHASVWAFRHWRENPEAWVRETSDLPPQMVSGSASIHPREAGNTWGEVWELYRQKLEGLQRFYDERTAPTVNGKPEPLAALGQLAQALKGRGLELEWEESIARDPSLWLPIQRLLKAPDGVERLLREREWSWGLKLSVDGNRARLEAPPAGPEPYVAYDHFVDRDLRRRAEGGIAVLFRKDGIYYLNGWTGLWTLYDKLWMPDGLAEFLGDRNLAVALLLPQGREDQGAWFNALKRFLDPRNLRRIPWDAEAGTPSAPIPLSIPGDTFPLVGYAGRSVKDPATGRTVAASFIVTAAGLEETEDTRRETVEIRTRGIERVWEHVQKLDRISDDGQRRIWWSRWEKPEGPQLADLVHLLDVEGLDRRIAVMEWLGSVQPAEQDGSSSLADRYRTVRGVIRQYAGELERSLFRWIVENSSDHRRGQRYLVEYHPQLVQGYDPIELAVIEGAFKKELDVRFALYPEEPMRDLIRRLARLLWGIHFLNLRQRKEATDVRRMTLLTPDALQRFVPRQPHHRALGIRSVPKRGNVRPFSRAVILGLVLASAPADLTPEDPLFVSLLRYFQIIGIPASPGDLRGLLAGEAKALNALTVNLDAAALQPLLSGSFDEFLRWLESVDLSA